jgi:hypothetical protein
VRTDLVRGCGEDDQRGHDLGPHARSVRVRGWFFPGPAAEVAQLFRRLANVLGVAAALLGGLPLALVREARCLGFVALRFGDLALLFRQRPLAFGDVALPLGHVPLNFGDLALTLGDLSLRFGDVALGFGGARIGAAVAWNGGVGSHLLPDGQG